ncbi:MAG: hypothetical protein FD143_3382 [Ignavibacteria bacterium]|nr:MAG: hypothetical protein FD143_3382 [Ignavibacteria bacterium]
MRQTSIIKAIRDKYGRLKEISLSKYQWQYLSHRFAEENLSCCLSVFYDNYRDQEWAQKLRDRINEIIF